MDLKKAGCKIQAYCYSKREEAVWPLLFLNDNHPVFYNLLFSGPYFGLDFFKVPDPKKISS
jgi:transcription antitermination factor NusA-like protein